MNLNLKRILTAIILTIMVFTLIPFSAFTAFADSIIISEIDLTYDTTQIILNTAYTEGEVDKQMRNSLSATSEGVKVDSANSGLMILQNSGSIWGVGNGASQVSTEKNYLVRYTMDVKNGYIWSDSVIAETFEGFTVKIDGVDRTDDLHKIEYNKTNNNVKVYFKIPQADNLPIVTYINIADTSLSVEKGGNHTFTGEVLGTVSDKSITWSVEGAQSANTVIDSNGTLTVGNDEAANTITVKASATADTSKFKTVTVTVLEEAPYISSVTVTPAEVTKYTGTTQSFSVNVEGTQVDKSITWSIEGANSANTSINDRGVLNIGFDETAEVITVKAIANMDNSKIGTSTVTITQRTKISSVDLTFNEENFALTTAFTEGEVQKQIKNNISSNTVGVTVDKTNSGLGIVQETGAIWGVADGTSRVDPNKKYVIRCMLSLKNQGAELLDWSSSLITGDVTEFDFKINGIDRTSDIKKIEFNNSSRNLTIYILLPTATVSSAPFTITLDVNGGNALESSLQTDNFGKLTLPTPTHSEAYMEFLGWYSSLEGEEKLSENTIFAENTMVYAHWRDTRKNVIFNDDNYTHNGLNKAGNYADYVVTIIPNEGYKIRPNDFTITCGGSTIYSDTGAWSFDANTNQLTISAAEIIDNLSINVFPKKVYTVTYPNGRYTIDIVSGTNEVVKNDNFSFQITIEDGYTRGDDFKVSANGVELIEVSGVYTVRNVTENIVISVEGIKHIQHDFIGDWLSNDREHWQMCICGERGNIKEHTPLADDGDCTTSIKCSICSAVTTEGNADHIPNADDNDCTTPITCSICGVETTPAKTAHTGGAATCTAKAKCDECGKEYGDFALHTPNTDDDDCTTPITCSACGEETTPAKAAHSDTDNNGKCDACDTEIKVTAPEDSNETDAPETEKPTEKPTEKATEKSTEKPTDAEKNSESEESTEDSSDKKSGCGSTISLSCVALVATLGTCAIFVRKKED